ncbi:MAG: hypothetical protein GY787_13405 [Alteromonadales bacterium]|nr:hypothetical protein [Alteromonadales bacterium]
MQAYIHKTDNRVRIRSDYIFENSKKVQALISELLKVDGILQIKYKKHAGSVAITFCQKSITQDALLETLASNDWLQETQKNQFVENALRKGTKSVLKGVVMLVVKKTLGAGLVRTMATI